MTTVPRSMENQPVVAESPPLNPPELDFTLIEIDSARAVAGSSTHSARIGHNLFIELPASLSSRRRVPRAGPQVRRPTAPRAPPAEGRVGIHWERRLNAPATTMRVLPDKSSAIGSFGRATRVVIVATPTPTSVRAYASAVAAARATRITMRTTSAFIVPTRCHLLRIQFVLRRRRTAGDLPSARSRPHRDLETDELLNDNSRADRYFHQAATVW